MTRRRLLAGSEERSEAGRVLLYAPDLNLADGAAEMSSEGFFDVNNMPPWGLWVGLASAEDRVFVGDQHGSVRALIAWVPDELVDLADAGVRVNPEDCVAWSEYTPRRRRGLRPRLTRSRATKRQAG